MYIHNMKPFIIHPTTQPGVSCDSPLGSSTESLVATGEVHHVGCDGAQECDWQQRTPLGF